MPQSALTYGIVSRRPYAHLRHKHPGWSRQIFPGVPSYKPKTVRMLPECGILEASRRKHVKNDAELPSACWRSCSEGCLPGIVGPISHASR